MDLRQFQSHWPKRIPLTIIDSTKSMCPESGLDLSKTKVSLTTLFDPQNRKMIYQALEMALDFLKDTQLSLSGGHPVLNLRTKHSCDARHLRDKTELVFDYYYNGHTITLCILHPSDCDTNQCSAKKDLEMELHHLFDWIQRKRKFQPPPIEVDEQ